MTSHLILDMTSHRRGFGVQPSIIDAAARLAETNHDFTDVLWLVPSHLMGFFSAVRRSRSVGNLEQCDIMGEALSALIRSRIEKIRSSTVSNPEIKVVTWDPFIYQKVRDLGSGVVAVKMADWINSNRLPRFRTVYRAPVIASPESSQTQSQIPSTERIQELAVAQLELIDATSEQKSILRSQLRPALERAFPELKSASFNTAYPSAFKMALDNAIATKRMGEQCPSPGHERIWAIQGAGVTTQHVTPAVLKGEPTQSSQKGPIYLRTAEFRKRLTDRGVFCEKRERDILLEAAERLLKVSPLTVSKLRRELPKVAKEIATERKHCQNTDFSRIVGFFLKLLLVSGSLRDQAGTMKRDASAEATAVIALEENAVDITETYLLEQILNKSDVKDHEHFQLVFTLLREFDETALMDDKLDRIAVLISRLKDRVFLNDDGTYEYVPLETTRILALTKP